MTYMLTGFLVFWVVVCILARKGLGGSLGAKIRASDWQAWRYAMDNKERELSQLRDAEPNRRHP